MLLLSKRLIDLRESLDLTRAAIAKVLSLSPSGYAGYETGRYSPSPEVLSQLASFYGVTVDYILGIEPEDSEFNRLVKEIRVLTPVQRKRVGEYIVLLKTYDAYQKVLEKELPKLERKRKRTEYNTNYIREQRDRMKNQQPQIAACGGGIVPIDDEIAEDMRNFNEAIEGGAVGDTPEKNHKG